MNAQVSAVPGTSYRWVILGITYLSMLSFAVVFQSLPPVLSLIIQDVGLSHAEAGLLMSLFALPGVVLSIPVGMLSQRYGSKVLTVLCLAAMIVGTLLVAVGQEFPVLALGRMIAGAGGIALTVVTVEFLSQWFAGRELGIAVGVYSTAMPIGTMATLNTLGSIGVTVGWRGSLLISVAVSTLALMLFAALHRRAPRGSGSESLQHRSSPFSLILSLGLPIWLLASIWMLFNASIISFLTFGPDYFLARGYGIEFAGFLASLLMLLAPPLAPLVGYIVDKLDHAEIVIALGGLLMTFSILSVLPAGSSVIILLLVLSLGNVLVPTPVFTLPPRLLKPQFVGAGYGIVTTGLNIGIVVGPYAVGLARDVTGSYEFSFYLMAFFSLLVVVAAIALRLTRSRAPMGALS